MHDDRERASITRVETVRLTRRRFLAQSGFGVAGLVLATQSGAGLARAEASGARPPQALLESSPYVYISPLKKNGQESRCHAEVWFAWLDDSVVVTVASDRWKARALANGLTEARIWVGDHGRWKTMLGGRNEKFRKAPNFKARAERVEDAGMIDRLLAVYEEKYPAEIASWRDGMRSGNADGSRIMIRYRAID